MLNDHRRSGRLRFGVFELDLRNSELRKQGLKVRLQAQPFEVLLLLLEQQGQVVSREEIQKKVWPANTFVDFDHGLNKAINKIREALGDSAESPRFRRNSCSPRIPVSGRSPGRSTHRGPRLATPRIGRTADQPESDRTKTQRRNSNRKSVPTLISWKGLLVALLIVTATVAAWKIFQQKLQQSTRIHSLAVLPLESLSNDTSQDYFADGMTDELISDLGQIGALRVISRTSAMTYKHAQKPLPEIAHELNVDAVVEGTVLRSGDRVRITAQLIDGATDKHLWSQSYEGDLRDTLGIAKRSRQSHCRPNPDQTESARAGRAKKHQGGQPEAYESYLKGRFFWNKRTGRKSESRAGVFQPGHR